MTSKICHSTIKSPYHENNEDHVVYGDGYIILADGMGGESDGDKASRIATYEIGHSLSKSFSQVRTISNDEVSQTLFQAIQCADQAIIKHIDLNPDSFGMGTTAVIAIIENGNLRVCWCGDSRCYVYNPQTGLKCLTHDHSYVQELIDKGDITVAQSYTHPENNLITRYVGGGPQICQPEYMTEELSPDDMVIVCSDGLSGYCTTQQIEDVISHLYNRGDNQYLCTALTNLALKHGSDDDITVAVYGGRCHCYKPLIWVKKLMGIQ